MKKALILPLLIPLLVYGAVKGYLWYQVKRFADEVAVQISPFASFEYGSIETSFDGEAGVRDVRVFPRGSSEPIRIAAIRVLTDNWLFLLKSGTPLDKGDLPSEMAVEILGLSVDLQSPYLGQMAQYSNAVNTAYAGCEKSDLSGLALYEALGFESLYSDLKLSYQFDSQSQYLNLTMAASSPGMFELEMGADMDMAVDSLNRDQLKAASPKLGGVQVFYHDQAFNRRYLAHCAELYDETVEQFVDRHVGLLAQHYRQLGFSFNDEMIEAYRAFLLGEGSVRLQLSTEDPMGIQALSSSGVALFDHLDLSLQVNGSPVAPINFDWEQPSAPARSEALVAQPPGPASDGPQPTTEHAAESMPADVAEVEGSSKTEMVEPVAVPQQEEPAPVPVKKRYRKTPVASLDRYVGESIRIQTHNGREIEGTIAAIDRKRVHLEKRLSGGVAAIPVLFSNIEEALVYR